MQWFYISTITDDIIYDVEANSMDGSVTMALDDYDELRGMKTIVDNFTNADHGTHDAVFSSNHGMMAVNLSKSAIENCYRQLYGLTFGTDVDIKIIWSD